MGDQRNSSQDSKMKWSRSWEKAKVIFSWMYKLRSIVLAIPVAAAALIMALHNLARLPALVGLNLQANGEYAQMVGKGVVVFGPLALTAVCLLLMFCSKKVLYPWLISVFSLAIPLLVYITSVFPG